MQSRQLCTISSKQIMNKFVFILLVIISIFRIPKIIVLSAEYNEFNVSEDEFELISLDASNVPLVTSYTKIGSKFIVDTTWEEEESSVGTIAIAFLPPNEIVLMKKIRPGSINSDSFPNLYEVTYCDCDNLIFQNLIYIYQFFLYIFHRWLPSLV